MKSGDQCSVCGGMIKVYATRRSGDNQLRFLRCSEDDCSVRGKQIVPAAAVWRRQKKHVPLKYEQQVYYRNKLLQSKGTSNENSN